MMIASYILSGAVVDGLDADGNVVESIPVDENNTDYRKYLNWKNGITESVSVLPVLGVEL